MRSAHEMNLSSATVSETAHPGAPVPLTRVRSLAGNTGLGALARLVAMSLPLALAVFLLLGFAARAQDTALPADLVGKWLAEDIGGNGVIDYAQSVLEIEEAGTVAGSTGCNTMFGQIRQGGGVLKIGPLAVTRKACPPAVMDQERKFVDALNAAVDYRSERGKLILLDAKSEPVVTLTLM